ncbi:MAG TPA: endonuclease, partial [Brevundimonas sp.]|nr:endonuclease [Brevundimonas sp.]
MPRLMSYNVHRCVGMDRKLDLDRIVGVIAEYE